MRLLEQAMMQAPGFRFGRAGRRRGRFAKNVRHRQPGARRARRTGAQTNWMARKGPGLQWGGGGTPTGPIKIDNGATVRPIDPGIELAARRSF